LSFIRLIERAACVQRELGPNLGTLLVVYALLLSLTGTALAGRDRVFKCEANGQRIFQDRPCGSGEKPWERGLTDRTRWSNPVRTAAGACAIRSPSVALSWLRNDQPIIFDGGVSLVLNASESGVAATIVVEARWPNQQDSVGLDVIPSPEISLCPDTAVECAQQTTPATAQLPAQPQGLMAPDALSARRVELSGNISGHAILPDAQAGFVVDSMEDPTRMRYGYRQTSNLLRALKHAVTLKFRLTLRSPEVSVISAPLELNGLENAVRAVQKCAE
jgi:hypothetical protein